jgi:hypothetical protein
MCPQLSKSLTSLTSKTTSLRGCVTAAKFNSSDYEYVRHDKIAIVPAVQHIHRPTTGKPKWNFKERAIYMHTVCCLFTEPDPPQRVQFDGTSQCTQEGHSLFEKVPEAETAASFNRLCKKSIKIKMVR